MNARFAVSVSLGIVSLLMSTCPAAAYSFRRVQSMMCQTASEEGYVKMNNWDETPYAATNVWYYNSRTPGLVGEFLCPVPIDDVLYGPWNIAGVSVDMISTSPNGTDNIQLCNGYAFAAGGQCSMPFGPKGYNYQSVSAPPAALSVWQSTLWDFKYAFITLNHGADQYTPGSQIIGTYVGTTNPAPTARSFVRLSPFACAEIPNYPAVVEGVGGSLQGQPGQWASLICPYDQDSALPAAQVSYISLDAVSNFTYPADSRYSEACTAYYDGSGGSCGASRTLGGNGGYHSVALDTSAWSSDTNSWYYPYLYVSLGAQGAASYLGAYIGR